MSISKFYALSALLLISFPSCTSVKVLEMGADGKLQKTGLKVFTPKPYLLVIRNPAKETPIKVEVVYLPDTMNPQYLVHQPGWGKLNFTTKMKDGMLTEFGSDFDSQVAETIGSFSDLLSSVATGYGDFEAGSRRDDYAKDQAATIIPIEDLDYAKKKLQAAENALSKELMADAEINERYKVTDSATFNALANDLQRAINQMAALAPKELDNVIKQLSDNSTSLNSLISSNPGTVEVNDAIEKKYRDALKKVQEPLNAALRDLKSLQQKLEKQSIPTPPAKPEFELYEIQMKNGKSSLKRVQ